jgi:hypothetical protein
MRWLGVIAVAGMAFLASAASGGDARTSDRCAGTPSWKYVQTLTFVEPNGSATFAPDPTNTYKLVISGYVKDPNGASLTVLETYGSVEAFRVNGQEPPLYQAALWHRNHPLKDPTAFAVAIQVDSDGKSLDFNPIADSIVTLPPPHDANKPCTLGAGTKLPGAKLSLTPETSPPSYYTGTVSIAVYKEVFGSGEPEPPAKVQSNITFTGGSGFELPTTRPGEKRLWVSASGSAQLSTDAQGQLKAVGGGAYAGVYTRPGPNPGDKPVTQVRRWRFRIDSVAEPPSGGEVKLNATVTTSTQESCPTAGAKVEFVLRDSGKAAGKGDTILVRGGGCLGDVFTNRIFNREFAFVTVEQAGS